MTSRDFCYWLQGHLEIAPVGTDGKVLLNAEQVATIQQHLAMVFQHEIDPSFGDDLPKLRETHSYCDHDAKITC